MIIKLEDRKLEIAKELKQRVSIEHVLFCLMFSSLWAAMIAWVLTSWL